jgi:integrase
MKKKSIEEVAALTVIKLKELGLSTGTISLKRDRHFKYVISHFHEKGILEYDDATISSFIKMVDENEGKFWCHKYCLALKRAALQLREYFNTGTLIYHPNLGEKEFNPSLEFMSVLNKTLATTKLKPEFQYKIVGVLRRFCCWLENNGVNSFCDLKKEHIFNYFRDSNKKRARATVSYDIYAIRLLIKYLEENNICKLNFDPLILKPAKKGIKIIPPFSKKDFNKILGAVDRNTLIGKRNYAILLLGITTGMRAGDIVKLTLADINWNRYEISFKQSKTSRNLVIPLKFITGNAIGDYILTARPKSLSQYIFLTINFPVKGLKGASSLDAMLVRYCEKAGVQKNSWQSFHSLRRSLSTWMVNSGTSVLTVSQVLGHTNLSSTDRYISADIHMVDCSLNFSGIPVESEVLQ